MPVTRRKQIGGKDSWDGSLQSPTTTDFVMHIFTAIPITFTQVTAASVDHGVSAVFAAVITIFCAVNTTCNAGTEEADGHEAGEEDGCFHDGWSLGWMLEFETEVKEDARSCHIVGEAAASVVNGHVLVAKLKSGALAQVVS